MMQTLVLSAVLCLSTAQTPSAELRTTSMLEVRIYEIAPQFVDGVEIHRAGKAPASPRAKTTLSLSPVFKSPAFKIDCTGKTPKLTKPAEEKEEAIRLLTSPSLVNVDGEEARMVVGQEGVQYLEVAGEGLFRLREEKGPLGFSIGATWHRDAGDAKKVHIELDAELNYVVGREVVEGVSLDLGKPILASWAASHTYTAEFGQWAGILVANPLKPGFILIARVSALRNREVPATAQLEGLDAVRLASRFYRLLPADPGGPHGGEPALAYLYDPREPGTRLVDEAAVAGIFTLLGDAEAVELFWAPRITLLLDIQSGEEPCGPELDAGAGNALFDGFPSIETFLENVEPTEKPGIIADIWTVGRLEEGGEILGGQVLAATVSPAAGEGINLNMCLDFHVADYAWERVGLLRRRRLREAEADTVRASITAEVLVPPGQAVLTYESLGEDNGTIVAITTLERLPAEDSPR